MQWWPRVEPEQVMPLVLTIALPLVATLCLVRGLVSWSWGSCSNSKSQSGRVFIVTGANSGLGRETARMLAKRKARVVMACRDMAAAYLAVEDIRRSTSDGELVRVQQRGLTLVV